MGKALSELALGGIKAEASAADFAETGFPTLPDVTVLVALTNPSDQNHARAHRWLAAVSRFATTPITEKGPGPPIAQSCRHRAGRKYQTRGRNPSGCAGRYSSCLLCRHVQHARSRIDLSGFAGYNDVVD